MSERIQQIERFQFERDIHRVIAIEQQCFGTESFDREAIRDMHINPGYTLTVARHGGNVTGYIASSKTRYSVGYLDSLAVDPQYRRMGVGGMLIESAIETFINRGVITLTLHVRTTNKGAIELYEKLGFIKVEKRMGYYTSDSGNAWFMQLEL